jgi:hypothetical protein
VNIQLNWHIRSWRFSVALIGVFICFGVFVSAGEARPPEPVAEDVKRLYEQAFTRMAVSKAGLYSVNGKLFAVVPGKGILVITATYAEAKGYRGPPVLAITIDPDAGRVKRVAILSSPDTARCVRRVEARLPSLSGQAVVADKKRPIIAISKATKTSRAVTDTVNRTLDSFAEIFPGLELGHGVVKFKAEVIEPLLILRAASEESRL